ncbi:MAG: TIR domain-containing protein [Paludisphaera borealis]|uniref:TIR domain-containing protein n=1 Tax=Paludisphaera borealis TaxID=1387353 RepID=UPI00283D96E9|nr:TIR domain-containing protein [Paludisphaera borealis]MDR3619311.1 TIR domain-containing protein [Paludisphaera borealis]
MMNSRSLSDVFNEAQVPAVTFVQPQEFSDIVGSIRTPGKHITLCGPSGCGKTTLARKALDRAKIGTGAQHWMSGRSHVNHDAWQAIFASEFGCSSDDHEVLQYLATAGILVIDDFHHLRREVRDAIGRNLKLWHEKSIRVLIIGIAESAHDLLQIDSELGIRNDPYDMKVQNDSFIGEVIRLGEEALNLSFNPKTRQDFISASKGIPSAIQVICRIACQRNEVFETLDEAREIICPMRDIRDGVLRSYRGKYQNKITGMAKGKQQAASVHNTYFQIIKHICLLDKSEIHVQELRDRIVGIEEDPKERAKKNTSLYNCLDNLQDVIQQRGLADALYYDPTSKTISIEDPSFRLYLSLTDLDQLEKSVKVRKTRYPWDVALSFAGEQRSTVESFREELNAKGYTVFYDFDQQHQLWGQNLRVKLADVYANEAEFMVVFLSKEYPEKDWPSFEIEIGKEARGKRTGTYLLPIRVDDVHIVGLSSDVSYMDLRMHTLEMIVNTLVKKIEYSGDSEI